MNKIITTGVASLMLSAIPVLSTFAETVSTGSQSYDVTVGEVDKTIYSVDIQWGDMSFDWKYNESTNEFDFQPHHGCTAVSPMADGKLWVEYQRDNGWLFSDSECHEQFTGDILNDGTYYAACDGQPMSYISVTDSSIAGKIKPTFSFTPEDDYGWVSGVFGVFDSGFNLEGNNEGPQFKTGEIVTMITAGNTNYSTQLLLEKNSGKTVDPSSVSAGDKIGTVTVNIEPDLD